MVACVFGSLMVQTADQVLSVMAKFLGIFTPCRHVADFVKIEANFQEINKFLESESFKVNYNWYFCGSIKSISTVKIQLEGT